MKTLKPALIGLAAIICLPVLAQKVKVERSTIFTDKKEKLLFEPAYKAMLRTSTYAIKWSNPSSVPTYLSSLGKAYGKMVSADDNPDYVFELSDKLSDPMIEYIQFSEMMSSNVKGADQTTIARIVYHYNLSLTVHDNKNKVSKTYVLSNEDTPYIFAFCINDKTPSVFSLKNKEHVFHTDGWRSRGQAEAALNADRERFVKLMKTEIGMNISWHKIETVISYLMQPHEFDFKMFYLDKKQAKDYPELAAQIDELRNCLIQWARNRTDEDNRDKMLKLAIHFDSHFGVLYDDSKLKLLSYMNAALAYIACNKFDNGLLAFSNGRKEDRSILSTASNTVEKVYEAVRTIDFIRKSDAGKSVVYAMNSIYVDEKDLLERMGK